MGQVLHGSATTTAAIRRAVQNSEGSLGALSKRYWTNQKTVAKWKKKLNFSAGAVHYRSNPANAGTEQLLHRPENRNRFSVSTMQQIQGVRVSFVRPNGRTAL